MKDERFRVLLVDDDVVVHQMVLDMLRGEPFQIYRAADWSTMSEVLFCEIPEVILLDVRLPGVNGDSIALIVHDTVVPRPRIVLYSATPVDELAKLAIQAGAFSYVEKGSGANELIRQIRAAGLDYRAENEGSIPPSSPFSSPPRPIKMPPRFRSIEQSEPPPLSSPPREEQPAAALGSNADLPNTVERSVLVAASPGELRSLAQTRMLSAGFLVHTADTWSEAIRELAHDRTGLILLDPSLFGVSAIRLRKTIEAKMTVRPRLLLWSATSPNEIEGLARDLNADGVVSMEVSARALAQIVGSAMRGR